MPPAAVNSPATLPEFHAGRPPRNTGMHYPADPPTIEEIIGVMRGAGDGGGQPVRSIRAARLAAPSPLPSTSNAAVA